MAVRQDRVQLNIEFITDESKALARVNQETRALNKELKDTVRSGGDVADVMRRIEAAGKKAENIDLTRIAQPALVTRAKQLAQIVRQIPESNPKYAEFNAELKRVNDRLATLRRNSRGVADTLSDGQGRGIIGLFTRTRVAVLAFTAAAGASLSAFAGNVIRAGGQAQKFAKTLENALGSRSAALQAIQDITTLADDIGIPANDLIGSYTKLVNRGITPTIAELRRLTDLAASQGKELDQLAEAALDAATGEFERLKEFGIRAKSSGDQVALSFRGQTVEIEKTQNAILQTILGFSELDGVQGSAAAQADNLQAKVDLLTSKFDRFFAALANGFVGSLISGVIDGATALVEVFTDLNAVQTDVTANVRKTQVAFNNQIETLKRSNVSAETRKRIIDDLNANYPDYLDSILTEETSLGELARAQEFANRAFEKRIRLLASEQALTDIARRQIEAKTAEVKLEGDLTAALQRTKDAADRARDAQNGQAFAGTGAARSISGQAAANDLAAQAQERVNAKRAEQIELEKEFQRVLAQAQANGVDVGGVLDGDDGGPTGGGPTGGGEKDTLANRLSALQEKAAQERAEAERAFIQQEITEQEYNERLSELRQADYTRQLAAYADFGQQRLAAARGLQNELFALQQRQAQAPALVRPALGALPDAQDNTITSVGRRNVDVELEALRDVEAQQAEILQESLNRELITEEQFAIGKLALKREILNQEIAVLSEGTAAEVAAANAKKDQLLAIDQELFDKRKALAEQEKTFRAKIAADQLATAQDALGAGIELLGRDEAARKKNADAIKALQAGQAILNGIAEVTAIRLATAKEAASVALIPGASVAVNVKGAIKTGIAIAKTAANVAKINATKFGRGGKAGTFGGRPHSHGGTRGYFEDGTQIEVEADEDFFIINKRSSRMRRQLSTLNQWGGGVPLYNDGGAPLAPVSLTPQLPPGTLAAPTPDNSALLARIDRLTEVTANMQTNLTASVDYGRIETAADELQQVRNLAQI